MHYNETNSLVTLGRTSGSAAFILLLIPTHNNLLLNFHRPNVLLQIQHHVGLLLAAPDTIRRLQATVLWIFDRLSTGRTYR